MDKFDWSASEPKKVGVYDIVRKGKKSTNMMYWDGNGWKTITVTPQWKQMPPKYTRFDWISPTGKKMPARFENMSFYYSDPPRLEGGIMWGISKHLYTDTQRIDEAIKRGLLLSNFRQEIDKLLSQ